MSQQGFWCKLANCFASPCSRRVRGACLRAGQLQQAEQEASRWRSAASQTQAAAAKLEADMEGLGTAYNMLETHSHDLEARIQELESTGSHPAYMLANSFNTQLLPILLRPSVRYTCYFQQQAPFRLLEIVRDFLAVHSGVDLPQDFPLML